jgi:hypothetical protein
LEQIAQSADEVSRCNDELSDIRENQLRLKREMDGLRDELFRREDVEAIIVDEAHVVTDGENASTESAAKKAWDARAKHLKQVRWDKGVGSGRVPLQPDAAITHRHHHNCGN